VNVRNLRGVRGSVRWSYHRAAEVLHWHATRDKATPAWSLRATVVQADPFLGARSGLHFVAQLKGGHAWQWPVLELQIAGAAASRFAGGTLTARLGPIEVTGGAAKGTVILV
jgi:hypothetical protein